MRARLGLVLSNERALQVLEHLLLDEDRDVKAHAAYRLWRAGRRLDPEVLVSGLDAINRPESGVKVEPDEAITKAAAQLLTHDNPDVRLTAARSLGQWWGHREQAVPAARRPAHPR